MFSKAILSILFLAILGSIHCDSLPDTPTQSYAYVDLSHFRVEPTDVNFDVEMDGFKDTTLQFTLYAQLHNSELLEYLGYIIREPRTGVILLQEQLTTPVSDPLPIDIQGTFNWETSTTNFEQLLVELYALDRYGYGIQHQATLTIEGIASSRPQIIWVNNPDSVEIPTGSTTLIIPFQAKVTDPDGQETLDRVFIAFENEDGSILVPNPNILTDTGTGLDEVAGDSVFTITFSVNSSNSPQNRTVLYYARDKAGLFSDTLKSSFNIINPYFSINF